MDEWDINRKIDSTKYSATDLPSYPVRTLVGHVALKGIQAGAVIGLVAGVPLISYLRKLPFSQAWRRVMPITPIIGGMATLGLLYAKNLNEQMGANGIDDRAYRILHNKGQVKVDQRSIVGGAIGAALGTVIAPGIATVFAAASTGVAAGTLFHVIDNFGIWKLAAKQVEVFKKEFGPK